MSLQSAKQLDATRKKLAELEQLYEKTKSDDSQSGYGRELTLRSIRKTINQFKEEIARFEAHANANAASD